MATTEIRALPSGNVEVVVSDGEVTVGIHYTKNDARHLAALILQATGDPLYRDVRDIVDFFKRKEATSV